MDDEDLKNEPVIRVKIIQQEGEWALVEEISTLKRMSVPVEKIEVLLHGMAVPQSVFDEGMSYGVAWETIKLPKVTAESIAFEMRRHGLQTATDVRKQPGQVIAALRAAYGPVIAEIFDFSKKLGG